MSNLSPVSIHPPAITRFSSQFFHELTFADLHLLDLPTILPLGALQGYLWTLVQLNLDISDSLRHGEAIPNLKDLHAIMLELDTKITQGFTGVTLQLWTSTGAVTRTYTVAKLRLCVNINNNLDAVLTGSRLYHHLQEQLPAGAISKEQLEAFGKTPIDSYLQGFSTKVKAWALGCLVGERDVFDTVLDLRIENTYLQARLSHPRTPILCSAMFIPSLLQLHQLPSPSFNEQLIDLRSLLGRLITLDEFGGLFFMICQDGHYTSYHYNSTPILYCGDSLGSPSPRYLSTIQGALNWFLSGLGAPLVDRVEAMNITSQGLGSRSCALAAFNGIELKAEIPRVPKWDVNSAEGHRQRWLLDLVHHHLSALPFSASNLPWYWSLKQFENHEVPLEQVDDLLNSYAWDCWNTKILKIDHPFLDAIYATRGSQLGCSGKLILGSGIPPTSTTPVTTIRQPRRGQLPPDPIPFALKARAPPRHVPFNGDQTPQPAQQRGPKTRDDSGSLSRQFSTIDLTGDTEHPETTPTNKPSNSGPLSRQFSTIDLTKDTGHPDTTPTNKPSHTRRKRSDSIIIIPSSPPKPSSTLKRRRKSSSSSSPEYDEAILISSDAESDVEFPSFSTLMRSSRAATRRSRTGFELGSVFLSAKDGVDAVLADAEACGYVLRRGQTQKDRSGEVKRIKLRCQSYGICKELHDPIVHPADHRSGRSNRTCCPAHVNLRRVVGCPGQFYISLIEEQHNHPAVIPEGGRAQRAPTQSQISIISRFAQNGTFSRQQIRTVLEDQNTDHPLEARQLTNLMNSSRRQARDEINALGGDIGAIITELERLRMEDPGWEFRTKAAEDGTITALWWQSPAQGELAARYCDLLISDNTYNRNRYGYPLNIGVIIDNFGKSRNIWYCYQKREDSATHEWVLNNHLSTVPSPPELLATDRDPALESVVPRIMPSTFHLVCLSHLGGNIAQHLRLVLGERWAAFQNEFWKAYRAVSPEIFERLYQDLIRHHPAAASYLNANIYPIRQRWAWAWISCRFTGGLRTNGRVEAENRVNKALGGPKVTFLQLFNRLNDRTVDQSTQNLISVRDASRRQHPSMWQNTFARVITLLEKHVGPYAMQVCWKQMELSLNYNTTVIPLPQDLRAWAESLRFQDEPGFTWANGEERGMINRSDDDSAYIATPWLLHQVSERRLDPRYIIEVAFHGGTSSSKHLVVLLSHDRYLCDCAMGVNRGVPCRHYFAVLRNMHGLCLRFHIGLIRPRWLQNPRLDPSTVDPVTLEHIAHDRRVPLTGHSLSNPLHTSVSGGSIQTPPPATQTLLPQEIHRAAQAVLKTATRGIQTQEQLDRFMERMSQVEREEEADMEARQPIRFRDPVVVAGKGRPRTERLKPSREQPRQSGSRISSELRSNTLNRPTATLSQLTNSTQFPARVQPSQQAQLPPHTATDDRFPADGEERPRKRRRCGRCREVGHNQTTCSQP